MTRSFKKSRNDRNELSTQLLHDREYLALKRQEMEREVREHAKKLHEYLKLKGEED